MIGRIILPTIVALALLLNACNGCSNTSQHATSEPALDFESISIIDSIDAIFYALPSPEEIITYINDTKVVFNADLMQTTRRQSFMRGMKKRPLPVEYTLPT